MTHLPLTPAKEGRRLPRASAYAARPSIVCRRGPRVQPHRGAPPGLRRPDDRTTRPPGPRRGAGPWGGSGDRHRGGGHAL